MKDLFIKRDTTVKQALKRIDETAEKILIVVKEKNVLLGTLTDGDIRRHILNGGKLADKITDVYNANPTFLYYPWNLKDAKEIMIMKKIEAVPVLNSNREVIDVLFWNDVFKDKYSVVTREKIDIPVVIMAGGKGSRLDPFTRILPKPLIPIGEKPVIEVIMEKFVSFGIRDFYISLNYKGEMIKSYFDYKEHNPYNIRYIYEKEYLGTGGSLALLPDDFPKTFFLSNCDIIVDANYYDLLKFHRESKNYLTILGSIQHHVIPYGIVEFDNGGFVKQIIEKPEYDFTANTGIYVVERDIIQCIPRNILFHTTDLIDLLLKDKKRVGVYPVSEKAFIDIGQWEEYKKAIESLNM